MEPDPPMTASPKLPGPSARDVYRHPLEPSQRTDASMQEIERLLKVNHDLQQQVAQKVPEAPWSLSPERPREVPGSRCQAALAALEPVALPERCGQSLLASSRGSNLPDMNRWEAFGSLTAEKEALTGKLKSEELLQLESVRLATEAEARLARVNAELDALRKPPQGSEKLASSEELEAKLRQQLQAVRADCDARQRRMQDYDGSLQRSNSALASLRADKELAISDHGELREKALAAREQLESRIQCLRSARAVLAESRRHASPKTSSPRRERLSCARTAVVHLEEQKQKEHEVLSTRKVLRDLQQVAAEQRSAVQRIKAGNEEMVAKSARGASERTQAAQHAASMVEERSREKHSLSTALQVTEKQLVDTEAAVTVQRQRESEALAAEQRRSVEELQEAEASLWALRSRLEDASSELQAEQEQNLRLRQEVLALQAAKEHILKRSIAPWDHAEVKGTGAVEDTSPGRSMPAWAKTHQQRLEKELEQLRKWKFGSFADGLSQAQEHAAGAVQRMALGLRSLRDQYDQEMRKTFDLQETWQRLGHRAENAGLANSFPSVQEADDLLQSEGGQHTRPSRAARRSPKAKEASRTAVNLSAGWWNGHGAMRSTRSRGRRDVQAPRAKSNSTGRLNKSSPGPGGHRVRAKLLS